jgi:hypothetical protein
VLAPSHRWRGKINLKNSCRSNSACMSIHRTCKYFSRICWHPFGHKKSPTAKFIGMLPNFAQLNVRTPCQTVPGSVGTGIEGFLIERIKTSKILGYHRSFLKVLKPKSMFAFILKNLYHNLCNNFWEFPTLNLKNLKLKNGKKNI